MDMKQKGFMFETFYVVGIKKNEYQSMSKTYILTN